jgi:hypothetical protein
MDNILTVLTRRWWPLVAAFALLFAPFMAATSYADEVPFKISYTGSLVPIPVNIYTEDDFDASIVDAQSHGTFGASMSHIVTEWTPIGFCDIDDTVIKFELVHAAVVVTFANGDQLFGAGSGGGEMCLDPASGYFDGVANGGFSGGTGRFEDASGTFSSPFSGHNITAFTLGYGFGPIQGTMEGILNY